jgi:3-hydroxybutyryl-CoA dehydrogenase
MSVKTFGVIGAGQMGGGIAQVAAMSGLNVIMNDIKEEFVERGLATITKILARNVDKGKITDDDKNDVLGRIKTSVDLQDMASADFVVEAATENEALKFQIFKDLDEVCESGVILATNTSSIPIGRIAAQTGRPDKVIGMHFMNPVPVMKLGMNHPMGPLALADLIGLDTCLAIMETLYDGFKDSKYRPCPLLRKYVEAGWLGRKTGKGFYEYK